MRSDGRHLGFEGLVFTEGEIRGTPGQDYMTFDKLEMNRPQAEPELLMRSVAEIPELSEGQKETRTRSLSPTRWRKGYEKVIADTIRKRQTVKFCLLAAASVGVLVVAALVALQLK